MPNLDDVVALAAPESFLAMVSTVRADATVQSTLVNAGVFADPTDGADPAAQVVAFVSFPGAKLRNLRARPAVAVAFRSGWQWITVEGSARIIGPDDPAPGIDAERLRLLLREVFIAAGGQHEDWAEYDQVMLRDRRAAVLVAPTKIYSNPGR
ncbi:MAG TPA: pyridoxamine 5'-phosphate oxidase family protein [Pseudonocardia sp.]|jgi:PPOX class probable F420-dependent enzyme